MRTYRIGRGGFPVSGDVVFPPWDQRSEEEREESCRKANERQRKHRAKVAMKKTGRPRKKG